MHNSEHIVNEGEGGLAMFDGKKAKVKDKIWEWRVEGSIQQRKQRNVQREGLINTVYTQSPSQQRHGPNLQGAMHDMCNVEQWGFQGGTHTCGISQQCIGYQCVFGWGIWGATESKTWL